MVRDQRVSSDDRDVLLAGAIGVSNRIGVAAAFEFRYPQLPTSFGIERTKSVVVGAADKNQTGGRHDRSGEHRSSGVLLPFRKLIGHAERALPREVTRRDVDGD